MTEKTTSPGKQEPQGAKAKDIPSIADRLKKFSNESKKGDITNQKRSPRRKGSRSPRRRKSRSPRRSSRSPRRRSRSPRSGGKLQSKFLGEKAGNNQISLDGQKGATGEMVLAKLEGLKSAGGEEFSRKKLTKEERALARKMKAEAQRKLAEATDAFWRKLKRDYADLSKLEHEAIFLEWETKMLEKESALMEADLSSDDSLGSDLSGLSDLSDLNSSDFSDLDSDELLSD
eukprot:TRINITY_DN7579_c0_g2_i1.p1 TRINITY_DN7579_c0_g2~~TRINITY_DN7579_c0_g2_i1.p1  ORF type:complete len:257 (+),score=61.89 TRINITY_DN7579_c0_g2_i1:80-772(+)